MLKVLRPEFVDAHGLKCGTTYQYRFTPYGRISRGGASIYFPYDEGNIENHTGLHTAYRQRAEMAVGRRNGDDESPAHRGGGRQAQGASLAGTPLSKGRNLSRPIQLKSTRQADGTDTT